MAKKWHKNCNGLKKSSYLCTRKQIYSDYAMALEKAMEVRRVWMQALSGKISKKELDAKGIRFMAVAE